MQIEKKAWPKHFNAVLSGKKMFEIKLDVFRCKPRSYAFMMEWNPRMKQYTGV